MTEFPSLRRLNVSYTLVHVVYWAMFAIFAGYQTSLLLGRGFTSGEAGIFASIRCFAAFWLSRCWEAGRTATRRCRSNAC